MSDQKVFFDSVKTRFGTFQIAATEQGVVEVNFPKRYRAVSNTGKIPRRTRAILKASKRFLRSYFSSQDCRFHPIPIDWRFFTPFDRRVLSALGKIPPQMTISYSALARKSGVPRAARAVGNVLNRNPIPILIPCHRVVRKDRSLGGYRGGILWKRTLLKLENHK